LEQRAELVLPALVQYRRSVTYLADLMESGMQPEEKILRG
jgi:hypothetical protein